MNIRIKNHPLRATAKIPLWLLSFDDAIYEQTIAGLNRDTENNSTLANLYEQDKAAIQTGFAIGRNLGQNFNSFMAIMASDMDNAGKQPAKDTSGNLILDASGKPMTVKQAYDQGYEVAPVTVDGQTINYATRQQLWGTGGAGNILATAVVGAFSGNVTGGASELIKNTAINVVRAYGATEIKAIADAFKNPDGSTNGTSETVRGLLHAIAGCAGASATGGDCAAAAVASGGTVAMNNAMGALLNLDPSTMTEEQKQAYSNLMGSLVSGVTSAVGGDATAAQLATKIEEDNNYLDPVQRILGFDAVNNQLARLQGHALTREQYEKRLMELAPTSEKMNKQMVADCLGGKASCGKQKAQAEEYMAWIKAMEDKGFLTPGKFGRGTAEALQQVATVNRPKYNPPQTPAPQNLGIGVLIPATMQGAANNSQTSQALGYQNSMNNIGYTGAIVAWSPYVVGLNGFSAEQAVGSVLGGVANATAQYTSTGHIDKSDVAVATVTGYVAPIYRLPGQMVVNSTGYVAQETFNGNSATWQGLVATGLGTGVGYYLGKAGAAIQWTPTQTSVGTSWRLPPMTDRYLPAWLGTSITTTSNIPSVSTTYMAPFSQEYTTNAVKDVLPSPINQKGN